MPEAKNTKFCSNCGAEIDIKAKICPRCGVEQPLIPEKVSNWWYVFAIFLGVVGGVIAWAVNKDRNPKKAIRFLIVGLVVPAIYISILAATALVSLGRAREKAKEARIIDDMNQLRTAIEIYYHHQEEGFNGVNCFSTELSSICSEIKEYAGEMPIIKSSAENYCVYVKLPSGKYYCFTNAGFGRETTVFPGESGFCDGITFSCP